MNRRELLKQVLATAAVGAVVPAALIEQPQTELVRTYVWVNFPAPGTYPVTVTFPDGWVFYPASPFEFSVDNEVSLGEDGSAMKTRANHGHSFTPAAQPQAQGNTPV